jgi:hypothetical protein
MASACSTVTAMTTSDVTFTRHSIADMKTVYFSADFSDLADKFVTNGHWHRNGVLRPLIPMVNVHVSTANGGFMYFNNDVGMAAFWVWCVSHPDAFFCV